MLDLSARHARVAALLALSALAPTIPAAADETPPLRIAVLYGNTEAGQRHRDGTAAAIEDHRSRGAAPRVVAGNFPYIGEQEGFRQLQEIVSSGDFDLVLGPTDSGVFVEARKHLGASVLVISSLVTTDVPNDGDGWFFRTNVDATERANVIYDFLNGRGFETIAVFYADTSFGRRAEEAFRGQLSEVQSERYAAFRYENPTTLRPSLKQILDVRPGAVGIFGPRHEIETILQKFDGMNNHWNTYAPLFFSIADARTLRRGDLHFVSIANLAGAGDEVTDLAFDTTHFVLGEAAELAADYDGRAWSDLLRERIAGRLEGPPSSTGPRTGMRFDRFENQAPLGLFAFDETGVSPVAIDAQKLVANWLDVRNRRFGLAPILNVALLILMIGWLSVLDFRKWHEGRALSFLINPAFLALVGFNIFTAVGVFWFLAETDRIRWDSLLATIGVALGYSALLKTTVFQTQAGLEFGLSHWYDGVLRWIHNRIMYVQYRQDCAKINLIAFTNSLSYLRRALKEIYDFAKTPERSRELMAALDSEIGEASKIIDKRKVCAKKVLAVMDWTQLKEKHLIPFDMPKDAVIDPETVIEMSADYCMKENRMQLEDLRALILKTLNEEKEVNPDKFDERVRELDESLVHSESQVSRFYIYLRWLFIQHGFRLEKLVEDDLLPPDQLPSYAPATEPAAPEAAAEKPPARRRWERSPADAAVELHLPAAAGGTTTPVAGRLRNESPGGALVVVATDSPAALQEKGARLDVRLESGAIRRGVVQHAAAREDGVALGVEYLDPVNVREDPAAADT